METVNNLASAASKAIWGETSTEKASEYETSGTEPVSGQTGDVKSGEPYDKGNLESATKSEIESASTPTTAPAYPTTDATADAIMADSKPNKPTTAPAYPTTDATADAIISDSKPSNPESEVVGSTSTTLPIRSEHETSKAALGTDPTPSTSADPFSAQKTTETQQDADRHVGSTIGPVGEDKGLQEGSHSEGTGEMWVKTTGVKADGGDFDATKPGAGKEADRLLEEKGVHREPGVPSKNENLSTTNTLEPKEKKSLKEKIKDKLHIHKEKD